MYDLVVDAAVVIASLNFKPVARKKGFAIMSYQQATNVYNISGVVF